MSSPGYQPYNMMVPHGGKGSMWGGKGVDNFGWERQAGIPRASQGAFQQNPLSTPRRAAAHQPKVELFTSDTCVEWVTTLIKIYQEEGVIEMLTANIISTLTDRLAASAATSPAEMR
eukprot:Sspe_Gene.102831::Locus_78663_Transcript_1_1_Confidence_1.000_Length_489::g.102831::m.102831